MAKTQVGACVSDVVGSVHGMRAHVSSEPNRWDSYIMALSCVMLADCSLVITEKGMQFNAS
jgi:hypothetical protein